MGRWDKPTCYRRGRHAVTELHAHLVFVTKYRRGVFNQTHLETINEACQKVCDDFGVELAEFNGEHDHVHLLIKYPPTIELSRLIGSLKGVSSRIARTRHPELASKVHTGHLWSRSYYAGSVGGAPINVLRQYIQNQRTPSADSPPP